MNQSLTVLDERERLNRHMRVWGNCVKCQIGHYAHRHVFYRGVLPCDILFVGLAPGRTEDALGWPFVGKSGRLLERWIADAVQDADNDCTGASSAFSYCICNLVVCRPCDKRGGPNRDPYTQEIGNCAPRLKEFIHEFARPRAVVSLGKIAAANMPVDIGLPTLAIHHPSYALRNGAEEDIKLPRCRNRQSLVVIGQMAAFFRKVAVHA
jgi:uracil-DNA glycosylase family 4